MGKLKGKVAVITGGTTGFGRATAELFRAEGATVVVTGTNELNLKRAREEAGLDAVACDSASVADLDALVGHVRAGYGRIDVLFVNAGVGAGAPIEQTDEAEFDRVVAINLRGAFFTVRQALPLLVDGAAVILTSSVGAHIGTPGGVVYSATKAAVRSMGRSLAAELMPRRIRVNTLTPGATDTALLAKAPMPAEQVSEMLRAGVPMGRIADASEIATAALFLASADSSFMTAAEVVVSGGQTDI